jgi:hypothetical protein
MLHCACFLQPRKVKLWHKLELISTSLCCERLVYEPSRTDQDVLMEADGMAGPSFADALQLYSDGSSADEQLEDTSSMVEASSSSIGVSLPLLSVPAAGFVANNVVPFPGLGSRPTSPTSSSSSSSSNGVDDVSVQAAAIAYSAAQAASTVQQQAAVSVSPAPATSALATTSSSSSKKGWNPADLVAAKLSEAAAAASAAALQPLASAAESLYAGSLSLVSSVTSSVTSTVISSSVPSLGPAADRAVRETIAGITSAEIAGSHPNSKDVKAASSSTGTKCPSEWFVCDDEASSTRYFVIQGSDSLDHWKTNLMFEPVVFEDAGLGVKVHRGAYEAAQALYERFLPLVQEQVDSDPCARVAFTVGWLVGLAGW